MLRGIGMGLLGLLIFPLVIIVPAIAVISIDTLADRFETVSWVLYGALIIGAVALWRWAVKEEKLERIRRRFD